MFDIAMRIDHPFREGNTRAVEARDLASFLVMEAARPRVELQLQGLAVDRQLGQRIPGEADSLDEM